MCDTTICAECGAVFCGTVLCVDCDDRQDENRPVAFVKLSRPKELNHFSMIKWTEYTPEEADKLKAELRKLYLKDTR